VTTGRPEPPDVPVTPIRWRAAALGILAGGVAVGFLASRHRVGSGSPLLNDRRRHRLRDSGRAGQRAGRRSRRAGRRGRSKPPRAADVHVLVGARDEAGVLPRLVRDVALQDYRSASGEPLFELIVVDDRSVDGSGEAVVAAARECGIDKVTRGVSARGEGLPDGKGAALTAAQPDVCRGDVVLVLDADARIEPFFLRRAAGYFAAGARRSRHGAGFWTAGERLARRSPGRRADHGRRAEPGPLGNGRLL
jgi:hypothetical protein